MSPIQSDSVTKFWKTKNTGKSFIIETHFVVLQVAVNLSHPHVSQDSIVIVLVPAFWKLEAPGITTETFTVQYV